MSARIDRNDSSRTFGPQPEVSPQRSKSTRKPNASTLQVDTLQVERPAISRTATPLPTEQLQDTAALYETGLFADPPKQKMWGVGSALLTDAHKHLTTMLRGECVRLHLYSRQIKQKLGTAERQAKVAQDQLRVSQDQLADVRSMYHSRGEKIAELTEQLREAHDSLAEMDAMLSETRRKRQNRLSGIAAGSNIQLGEYAS